jgi:uncharacterized protein (UPF0332 family)
MGALPPLVGDWELMEKAALPSCTELTLTTPSSHRGSDLSTACIPLGRGSRQRKDDMSLVASPVGLTLAVSGATLTLVNLDRAQESVKAAQLCLREGFVNSAASRAYYAIFQAAQVAMAIAGFPRDEWSHSGLQAAFAAELIHRRKIYPAAFRDYLSSGLMVRQTADYGPEEVSRKMAQRLVRRAASFVAAVAEKVHHAPTT